MILYFLIIILIIYAFFTISEKKLIGGNNFIKKICDYQLTDTKLENKNYIGKITGNIADFRDFSNNFYCKQPLRI